MGSSVLFMKWSGNLLEYSLIYQPQQEKGQNEEDNHNAIKNHLCPVGFFL
jgi:hypothetical protein